MQKVKKGKIGGETKMCEVKKAAAEQSGPVSSPPHSWLLFITALILCQNITCFLAIFIYHNIYN